MRDGSGRKPASPGRRCRCSRGLSSACRERCGQRATARPRTRCDAASRRWERPRAPPAASASGGLRTCTGRRPRSWCREDTCRPPIRSYSRCVREEKDDVPGTLARNRHFAHGRHGDGVAGRTAVRAAVHETTHVGTRARGADHDARDANQFVDVVRLKMNRIRSSHGNITNGSARLTARIDQLQIRDFRFVDECETQAFRSLLELEAMTNETKSYHLVIESRRLLEHVLVNGVVCLEVVQVDVQILLAVGDSPCDLISVRECIE